MSDVQSNVKPLTLTTGRVIFSIAIPVDLRGEKAGEPIELQAHAINIRPGACAPASHLPQPSP